MAPTLRHCAVPASNTRTSSVAAQLTLLNLPPTNGCIAETSGMEGGGVTCHDDLIVEGDAPEAESVRGQGAGGEPGGRPRHQQLRGVKHLVEPAQGLTARH